MRFARSHHRTDANEKAIVEALEASGALVFRTGCVGSGFPDLLCCAGPTRAKSYPGQFTLLEVKVPGGKLKPKQVAFQEAGWPVSVVTTPDEALLAVWG